MSLTQVQIKSTKAGGKPVKLFDGRGPYLEGAPSGGRWWRFKYRFEGKEKRLSLSVFPNVSLNDARERCDDARQALSAGIDPSAIARQLRPRALSNQRTASKSSRVSGTRSMLTTGQPVIANG